MLKVFYTKRRALKRKPSKIPLKTKLIQEDIVISKEFLPLKDQLQLKFINQEQEDVRINFKLI